MKMLKNEKGFTLIELVLVIVVLGILAAVATVQFGTLTTDAKKASLDGGAGPYNAQLALAVNTLKGLPTSAVAGAGPCGVADPTFGTCVYNAVSVSAGANPKREALACIGGPPTTSCSFRLYVDDDDDGVVDAGEWRLTVTYTGSTGALTVGAKSN